jgi:hypothetical protein
MTIGFRSAESFMTCRTSLMEITVMVISFKFQVTLQTFWKRWLVWICLLNSRQRCSGLVTDTTLSLITRISRIWNRRQYTFRARYNPRSLILQSKHLLYFMHMLSNSPSRIWGTYSGTIYGLTDYVWTLSINNNFARVSISRL